MYIYFNNNPCLRIVGDCAVRAISKALDISWERAYAQMIVSGYKMCDMPSSNGVWGAVLRQNGFKKYAGNEETFETFANEHPKGVYVLCTGTHVATCIDGDVYDAWNSLNEEVEYYFTKEIKNGVL